MRVGFGYDAHRLTTNRRLVLAGVHVPYPKGLMGHSDADVIAHAIGDALLGAAALGDLGSHFPPGNAAFKDISSLSLLKNIRELLQRSGYLIANIDATVVLEQPQIAAFYAEMRRNIASALDMDYAMVSIKAKTTEGMGFTGVGEGIACYAIALIQELDNLTQIK